MAKRAYTFAKATRAQMDEQSILTDSQKNGGLNIDVKDLAKKDELDNEATAREDADTQLSNKIDSIRPEFTFSTDVDADRFSDAYDKGAVLVFQDSVVSGSPIPTNTTRRFNLVSKVQRAGSPNVTLKFESVDGETVYKTSVTYDIAARSLTFGDIESYGIKDNDDGLEARIEAIENFLNGKKFLLADDQ